MLINADFSRRATVAPYQYQWVASPQSGVERVMLDRVGAEQARATSIVRYAPGACFPRHEHSGGEEIFVLSGVFSDEDGDCPPGWYLRNPPNSSHQPSSSGGAMIFVKLRQMPMGEQQRVRIDTRDPAAWHCQGSREVCPLFSSEYEQVCLQRLTPHEALFSESVGGVELLVLAGEVIMDSQPYERGSWIRLPSGESMDITAGAQGATVYLKTGHLVDIVAEEGAL